MAVLFEGRKIKGQGNLERKCEKRFSRIYTVLRKKHALTFSFISPWIVCGFKRKLQRIYPRNGRFWQCRN